MSEPLEELVRELRAKKKQIREAEAAVDEAKLLLAERRKAVADLRRGLEEIEDELTDPGKRRPLLAATAARPETADEPTAIELPGVELPLPEQPRRRGRKPKAAAVDPAVAQETRHYSVHRWHATNPGNLGQRLGSQIASDPYDALILAEKGWPGALAIGEATPHGHDCGCVSGVAVNPIGPAPPQWAVLQPVPGTTAVKMLGTVYGANVAQATRAALECWPELTPNTIHLRPVKAAGAKKPKSAKAERTARP